MVLILKLKNNKYILINTQDYEISNNVLRYRDMFGEHSVSFSAIQEFGFGKDKVFGGSNQWSKKTE